VDDAHLLYIVRHNESRSGMHSLTYEPQEQAEDALEVWSGGAPRQIPESRGATGCALLRMHARPMSMGLKRRRGIRKSGAVELIYSNSSGRVDIAVDG
jgi:hypothetical protein